MFLWEFRQVFTKWPSHSLQSPCRREKQWRSNLGLQPLLSFLACTGNVAVWKVRGFSGKAAAALGLKSCWDFCFQLWCKAKPFACSSNKSIYPWVNLYVYNCTGIMGQVENAGQGFLVWLWSPRDVGVQVLSHGEPHRVAKAVEREGGKIRKICPTRGTHVKNTNLNLLNVVFKNWATGQMTSSA